MPAVEFIRNLIVRAKVEGADKAQRELAGLGATTETVTKANLSLEKRVESLQRSLDSEYRAEAQLTKVRRELDAATRQGLLSQERANALALMATERYRGQGESAKRAAESMRVFREMTMGFVGGVAGGVLIGGLAELPRAIDDMVEKLGNTGNVAETIGVTTDALQQLRYAARLSDVEVGTLDDALAKFSVNLGNANSPLNKILALNNVKVSGDVLTDLEHFADLVKNASNQEERNVLVTTAFGKSAQEMGRLFEDGGAGIAAWVREAEAAGAVISEDKIERARRLNDQMEALKPRLEAAQGQFALLIAPGELWALGQFNNLLAETNYLLDQFAKGDWLEAAKTLTFSSPKEFALRQLKMGESGTWNPGLDQKSAGDFYSSFSQISKPVEVTVHGGRTKLPPANDNAAKQQQDAIDRVTKSLELQLKALTSTDRQAYIDQQLSSAKVTSASKEGRAIELLAGKYYDQKEAIEAANKATQFFAEQAESALEGLIDGSKSWTDVLGDMATALEKAVLQAALLGQGPLAGLFGTQAGTTGDVGGILGSLIGSIFKPGGTPSFVGTGFGAPGLYADGGVFPSPGGLHQHVNSVVDRPTMFAFAKGGVMGEAGPEAIMPLKRMANGALGVAANGNGGGDLIVNVAIERRPGAPGEQDSASATRKGNQIDVKATIIDTTAHAAQERGNPLNRALTATLGAKPTLTRRG